MTPLDLYFIDPFRLYSHPHITLIEWALMDLDLLKNMFNPTEAEVALAISNNLTPLEVVDLETTAARSTLLTKGGRHVFLQGG